MNDPTWASPEPHNQNGWMMNIDKAISYLKSVPHPWKILKKTPSGISKVEPWYGKLEKKQMKSMKRFFKEFTKQFEKHGYPQPLPPNNNIKINTWSVPFATFGGNSIYTSCGHDFLDASMYQIDPGRFLYA